MHLSPERSLMTTDVAPPAPPPPKRDLNTEMAAERTMLAWIRTGLALMGFGFVVSKFGLFLRRIEQLQGAHAGASSGGTAYSVWIGVSLVGVGVAVNLLSALRHRRLMESLRTGQTTPAQSRLAFSIALIMALIGVGIGVYLLNLKV
jgi:putative membrane protein